MENFPEVPSPLDHGWRASEEGIEPLWSEKEILPLEIVDIMKEGNDYDTDEDDFTESTDSEESDSELIV